MPGLMDALERAKQQAAGGDITGAAKLLSQAAGMSEAQAYENLSAYGEKREAVNMGSPTGLWEGSVTSGNIERAPVAVIKSTATEPQKQAAAQQVVKTTEAIAKPATPAVVTPEPEKKAVVERQKVYNAPPAPAPAPSFQYQPSTRTEQQLLQAARAKAALLIGTQRQGVQAGLAAAQSQADANRKNLNRGLAGAEERNRIQWASRGLANSGFLAGANALSQAATQREIGAVGEQERLAQEAAAGKLAELNNLQVQSEVANYDQLQQMERDYGLRERAQQFGEYTGQQQLGMQREDLNSRLAQNAFSLYRGQQLLPYELKGAGLSNDQAAFNLNRGQTLLPYEEAAAGLSNSQARFNLDKANKFLPYDLTAAGLSNDTAKFNLDNAKKMQPYQEQAQNLANQRTELLVQQDRLQKEIAENPDYGARALAQQTYDQNAAQIRLIESQITANNNKTATDTTKAGTLPYLLNKHGQFNPGYTTNLSALDKEITDFRLKVQKGQIATADDVADLLEDPDYVAGLWNANVDPDALLNWAAVNLPRRDPEMERLRQEGGRP